MQTDFKAKNKTLWDLAKKDPHGVISTTDFGTHDTSAYTHPCFKTLPLLMFRIDYFVDPIWLSTLPCMLLTVSFYFSRRHRGPAVGQKYLGEFRRWLSMLDCRET
jgi:hypothetical protein